jgi:hypothetical protein
MKFPSHCKHIWSYIVIHSVGKLAKFFKPLDFFELKHNKLLSFFRAQKRDKLTKSRFLAMFKLPC